MQSSALSSTRSRVKTTISKMTMASPRLEAAQTRVRFENINNRTCIDQMRYTSYTNRGFQLDEMPNIKSSNNSRPQNFQRSMIDKGNIPSENENIYSSVSFSNMKVPFSAKHNQIPQRRITGEFNFSNFAMKNQNQARISNISQQTPFSNLQQTKIGQIRAKA